MSKSPWFADVVGVTRIDIPEIGGWIEVRNELSIGEERRVFAGAIKGQTPTSDGKIRTEYDAEKVSFGMVVAHVSDWSARDANGKSVAFSEEAVRALKPSIYQAIEQAVDKHVKALRASRTEGNEELLSASGAAQTSPSAA